MAISWTQKCVLHIWIWTIYVEQGRSNLYESTRTKISCKLVIQSYRFNHFVTTMVSGPVQSLSFDNSSFLPFCIYLHSFLPVCIFSFCLFFSTTCLEVYLVRVCPRKPTQPTEQPTLKGSPHHLDKFVMNININITFIRS